MDTPASTAPITASPARYRGAGLQQGWRAVVLGLTTIAALVGAVAVVRLGAMTASSPPASWLVEIPPVMGDSAFDDAAAARRASIVAAWVSDPATLAARFGQCRADLAAPLAPQSMDYCIALIDGGLRMAPGSGELWLGKAVWLLQTKAPIGDVLQSLEASFRVAPREAWIAAGRVILGLRLYPLLTPELQQHVRDDLELVLKTNYYMPLVAAYIAEPTLRQAAAPALESLSEVRLALFLDQVRRANQKPGRGPQI